MPEADVFAPTFVDSDAMRVVAREKKVRGICSPISVLLMLERFVHYRSLHVNVPVESVLFLVAWVG